MSTRKYKSQVGTIPKIVNNFTPKTENQKLLYNKLSDFNNQLILWDDPNPWFQTWIERPIDANLIDFIIPEGDVEDLIIIEVKVDNSPIPCH